MLPAAAGLPDLRLRSEQYLCAALLRHGKAVASKGTVGLLSRLLPLLRRAFPRAHFRVRLDGGFATPEVFDFLEAQPRLEYVVAMAKNAVLERHAEPAMLVARSWRSEQTEHVYTETAEYQAGTWNHARRVIIKAEVVCLVGRAPRDNPRFVVTNMRQTPRFLYEEVYCDRGDVENRIKELKALRIDRTSCHQFSPNQLRVLLTAAAYVLMQELRLRAADTACSRAQAPWLRDRLLKLGVQVVRSVRRIVLRLPRATPDLAAWRHIAFALGGAPDSCSTSVASLPSRRLSTARRVELSLPASCRAHHHAGQSLNHTATRRVRRSRCCPTVGHPLPVAESGPVTSRRRPRRGRHE